MYMHDDTVDEPMQSVASLSLINGNDDTTSHKDDEEIYNLTSLDPLGDRIWSIVSGLLKDKSEITIQDILEATDIKESPVRTRLSLLVKLKHLSCASGTGRRPTYYFLPQSENGLELASPEYVVKALEKAFVLKEKEEKLLTEKIQILAEKLQAIQIAKASLQHSIQILQEEDMSNV